MDPIFKKLNFKNQTEILVLSPPDSFLVNLSAMQKFTTVRRSIDEVDPINFVITFVKLKAEIDAWIPKLVEKLSNDGVLWFAYPKKSSKRYQCDFNRDTGWGALGRYGYEGVRMVAIDEDWSALRFKKVEQIKKFTRNQKMAISEEGRKRAS